MAEHPSPTPFDWEDRFVARTELARMLLESRRRRRAAGERFLTEHEVDVLRGRAVEDEA